jgi:ferric-dicitrate binding protein FerR (iron transport regulator)
MKELWNASQKNVGDHFKTDDSWDFIRKTLGKKQYPEISGKRFPWSTFLKYAALILFLAGSAIVAYKYGGPVFRREIPLTYTEIVTNNGQKKEITLPDGTDVWINSGTFFRYASNYGNQNREVYLRGEAYFNVTRDKTKTFIVRTDNLTIKVLGTSFNVNCYPELKTVETTVITGTVSLAHGNQKDILILNKREKATYLKETEKIYISKDHQTSDPENKMNSLGWKKLPISDEEADYIASWKNQALSFNNETFEEIAFKLQKWFNVKITIKDVELKNYRYKGKFDDANSIFTVLEVIRLTTPIKYEYNENNREITIRELKD